VRKLEDVKPEARQAPSQARTVADDPANVGTPSGAAPLHPAPETPPDD
jgi:hypothetical protein